MRIPMTRIYKGVSVSWEVGFTVPEMITKECLEWGSHPDGLPRTRERGSVDPRVAPDLGATT
jgi:hypothetical protein